MNDKDYKISAVGNNVKEWSGAYGPMKTYIIRLEETGDEVIEMNQKPESPAPKEGDSLFGHIEDSKSKEFPTRKFKKVNKQFSGGGATSAKGSYAKSPEDRDSIYKCNALNNATASFKLDTDVESVLDRASSYYDWLVAKTSENAPESLKEQWDKTTADKEVVVEDIDALNEIFPE